MTVSPPETPTNSSGSSLEHLHKMSRTAGLGTTEYVAVNTIAVTTLILGLLSGLSLLGTAMLVLPAATLVMGVIAIVQIRRSAGTQSGVAIAALGIVLALVFVGVVGGKEVARDHRDATEQTQIAGLIQKFGKAIAAQDYDTAWNCFSERAQSKSAEGKFADLWKQIQASQFYGPVKQMSSNGIIDVADDPDTGVTRARGMIVISLTSGKEDRREAFFTKTDAGTWLFEDLQGFGPPPLKPTTPAAQ